MIVCLLQSLKSVSENNRKSCSSSPRKTKQTIILARNSNTERKPDWFLPVLSFLFKVELFAVQVSKYRTPWVQLWRRTRLKRFLLVWGVWLSCKPANPPAWLLSEQQAHISFVTNLQHYVRRQKGGFQAKFPQTGRAAVAQQPKEVERPQCLPIIHLCVAALENYI